MKIEKSISAKFGKTLILKNFCKCKLFASSVINSSNALQPCLGKQPEEHFQDVSRTVTPLPAAAGVLVALHCVWKTFQHKMKNSCCPTQLDCEHVSCCGLSRHRCGSFPSGECVYWRESWGCMLVQSLAGNIWKLSVTDLQGLLLWWLFIVS